LPTDDEISRVGSHLGHGPGPYPTKLKAQIVKTIRLAAAEAKREVTAETDTGAFCSRVVEVYDGLKSAGLPFPAATEVVAAVAPTIYRETRTPHP
jgi:hypothetical protein